MLKYTLANELSGGFGYYLTAFFFFLTGFFAGITCYMRAGISLGAGGAQGILWALFLSVAPFALMLFCAPFFVGLAGICAVMTWQGLLFGAGPALPMALLQIAVCLPALLFVCRKSLSLSVKWCKIKKATSGMRLSGVSEILPAALLSCTLCFISRIPAIFL